MAITDPDHTCAADGGAGGRVEVGGRGARAAAYQGVLPDGGFSIGFDEAGAQTLIHLVPRRAGDGVVLPQCGEWIADDGVVG